MKKLGYIIGVVGALVLMISVGCVEKFEADISGLVTEGLVVEGDIVSDSAVVFTLSKTLPLTMTDENEDLFDDYMNVDADLTVKGSDGSSWPGFWWGRGQYRVEIGTLKPEVEYHLEIVYNGDTYQSEPQKPLLASGIESVTFTQPDLAGPVRIHLDTKESDMTEAKYYLWYFEEDWEVRAHYHSQDLYEPWVDRIVHYDYPPVAQGWCYNGTDQIIVGTTESNVDNRIVGKTIHTIECTDHRLSFLYSIRIQQRNLTRKEYEYYQVRAKLNSDMGGLFTPQPSELPTNIVCSDPTRKVIGYVGCNMGVATHQLYISRQEVSYREGYNCDVGKAPDGSNLDKYVAGFQVCEKEENMIEWARIGCVDVRNMHADPMGRPRWWPNPYLYYKEEPEMEGLGD